MSTEVVCPQCGGPATEEIFWSSVPGQAGAFQKRLLRCVAPSPRGREAQGGMGLLAQLPDDRVRLVRLQREAGARLHDLRRRLTPDAREPRERSRTITS